MSSSYENNISSPLISIAYVEEEEENIFFFLCKKKVCTEFGEKSYSLTKTKHSRYLITFNEKL